MESILILMSTYNGEAYVSEQINSILNQKGVNIKLLIRDDGSTDNTLTILKQYRNTYPAQISLIEGENVGWRKSFMNLAVNASKQSNSLDYYAFSDQDDIWLPEKLLRGIEALSTLPEGPKLYCSNQIIYSDGKEYGLVRSNPIKPSVKSSLISNYATGCTIIFNPHLLELFVKGYPEIEMAHDYWGYILANLCGSVYVDHRAYILYRQHLNNQIGGNPGLKKTWMRRIKSIFLHSGERNREILAKDLINRFNDNMSDEGREAVKKISTYRQSIQKKFSLLTDNNYTYNRFSNDFWLKVRIIFSKL